ncbi:3-dehydroquinate synthase [Candidatus Pelagibacter sp.]|uniref:3-dehydroquinate synthase n=1 Tax=Candidatus Pelagibacter sp. TaxID=2024849 RepID=UPI003F850C03
MKPIKLIVKTNSEKYPIIIGRNLISNLSQIFKTNSINFKKCLLVLDKNIPNKYVKQISRSLKRYEVYKFIYNANEKNKNQKNVNKILDLLLQKNFSRDDCLISIGGGITGDVAGFAASLFKRGLKFVNIPTTLLSQVDSSVGGKTGINTSEGKNLIGSFYQPKIVISDVEILKSLPFREVVCGYAEIVKHALIANKKFYNFLNKNINEVLKLRTPTIERSIYESCKVKKLIVEKDEKEKNLRKILNFGHTFAHAYEASLNFSKKLNHGEAVILGMKSAFEFSHSRKLITSKEFSSAIKHLNNSHFPISIKNYFTISKINQIISFMMRDKKNNSKNIKLMLIKKIGGPVIEKEFSDLAIKFFLKKRLIN